MTQTRRISPANLSAQLHYHAPGNPPSSLPESAISNAFPGLEFDFRNIWRHIFEGIELHEADNYVIKADDKRLEGCRLLRVAGQPMIGRLTGPHRPGEQPGPLTSATNPDGVTMLEWSNSLADVLDKHVGHKVTCDFTKEPADNPVGIPADKNKMQSAELTVRPLFAANQAGEKLAVIAEDMVQPGDLTRGLCSPWQNDYRECACYYWAASRPDYVNIDVDEQGVSVGNNWLSVHRNPREYVLDDRADSRLLTYENLFQEWQQNLRFIVSGQDYPDHQ